VLNLIRLGPRLPKDRLFLKLTCVKMLSLNKIITISILFAFINCFTVEVQPNERICFFETMKVGERMLIGFQVHDGPDFLIDFQVIPPQLNLSFSILPNNYLNKSCKPLGMKRQLTLLRKGSMNIVFRTRLISYLQNYFHFI
jgi:hypothetical protein